MTRAPPVNLTIDMRPEAATKKDIRRRVASVIVIIGCLKRATPTSPSSSNIEAIPQITAKKPRRHVPSDDHTREHPKTRTLTKSITKGNMQDLRRPCPPQMTSERPSSSPSGLAPPQLRLQSNQATHERPPQTRRKEPTTKVHATTRAPLNAIIVAKQKPTPHLSKPCHEDAATHGEDAALHKSANRGRLRDDASKEEKDARTPSPPDPKDLRFPSGAQVVGRRSTPPRRRFQERSRHPRAPLSLATMETGAKITSRVAPSTCRHRPPPTNHQLSRPTSNSLRDPTIHRDQTRTTPGRSRRPPPHHHRDHYHRNHQSCNVKHNTKIEQLAHTRSRLEQHE
ncbi:hypothetical protein ZWY2020_003900 [Hordeum vulgare]|nr:hypothetical protein ZWY2020_003900 [Hordeum vulgare]